MTIAFFLDGPLAGTTEVIPRSFPTWCLARLIRPVECSDAMRLNALVEYKTLRYSRIADGDGIALYSLYPNDTKTLHELVSKAPARQEVYAVVHGERREDVLSVCVYTSHEKAQKAAREIETFFPCGFIQVVKAMVKP